METRARDREQRKGQITAVIYARVSSDAQDTDEKVSLKEQVEEGRRLCEQDRRIHVGDIYQDVGAGWNKERKEFKRLLEDGRNGKYQMIVCWRLDRLARGLGALVPILDLLDYYHIDIKGVRQELSKNMLSLVGVVGKMEIDALKERTAMGRRGAARNGRVPVHNVPYGYYVDEQRQPQVNEEQAAVIRRIFRLSTEENLGHRRIGRMFNGEGIPTPAAGKRGWTDGTVSAILALPLYHTGKWYYGRTKASLSQQDGKIVRRLIPQPKSEWIAIEFPAIVSEEVWQAARRSIQKRTHFAPRNTKIYYMLQQMVTCEECGLMMNARSHYILPGQDDIPKSERKRRRYYVCGGMNRGMLTCRNTASIPAELLEGAIWNEFERIITQPSIMIEGVASQSEAQEEAYDRLSAAVEQAEKERAYAELERKVKMRHIIRYELHDGLPPDSADDQFDWLIDESTERLREIDEKIADLRLRQEIAQHQMSGDLYRDWAANIEGTLDNLGPEERKCLVRSVFERITIDRDNQVTITAAIPVKDFVAVGSGASSL